MSLLALGNQLRSSSVMDMVIDMSLPGALWEKYAADGSDTTDLILRETQLQAIQLLTLFDNSLFTTGQHQGGPGLGAHTWKAVATGRVNT